MDSGILRILRWALIIFGVVLFLAIIVLLFTRPNQQDGSGDQQPSTTSDYATTGSMRFIQTGHVTAPENHYSVAITVSNSSRMIEIYHGYGNAPEDTKSFSNNQASYDAFLGALQGNGFMNTRGAEENVTFETFCTLGIRYTYQIISGADMPLNTWNSSCDAKAGTFAGASGQVRQLFINQIPDYSTIVSGVRL